MKSRNRRTTTSRTRKNRNRNRNRNRTRHGGGWFSSSKPIAPPLAKPKTYNENVEICKKDIDNKNCDISAKKTDYIEDKNKYGKYIRKTDVFPSVKPTKFEERRNNAGRITGWYYYPDGLDAPRPTLGVNEQDPARIDTPEFRKKLQRYYEIGNTVLKKYDQGNHVGYVKKDTPLTDDEVHSRSYEELEAFINSLPDLTPEDVNNEYIRKFNTRPGAGDQRL